MWLNKKKILNFLGIDQGEVFLENETICKIFSNRKEFKASEDSVRK